MENTETTYPVPNRHTWQILSGTGVKIAGIVLMTMDHLHQMFIAQGAPDWLSWFGRPVATMFLFLCAEGFFYTHDKKRYMLQLLGGSLFMSAMNQILSAAMPMEHIALINNIFGTLFMAAYYMWMLDRILGGFRGKNPVKILSAIGGLLLPFIVSFAMILALQNENRIAAMIFVFIPNPLSVEGGFALVFMGVVFYILRKYRLAQAALVLVISALSWYSSKDSAPGDFQWLMIFAVIPMFLYNGKRGRGGKYFFYVFYPAHIYLFYCVAWFLNGRV
ncbi:MAG: conjugal transfer protein TraX [Spirochaetaceae bacterium]|jgi:hypothetical protein|nr:conjugal transfer protein TraX [Spirochaetaceae bacterium]